MPSSPPLVQREYDPAVIVTLLSRAPARRIYRAIHADSLPELYNAETPLNAAMLTSIRHLQVNDPMTLVMMVEVAPGRQELYEELYAAYHVGDKMMAVEKVVTRCEVTKWGNINLRKEYRI